MSNDIVPIWLDVLSCNIAELSVEIRASVKCEPQRLDNAVGSINLIRGSLSEKRRREGGPEWPAGQFLAVSLLENIQFAGVDCIKREWTQRYCGYYSGRRTQVITSDLHIMARHISLGCRSLDGQVAEKSSGHIYHHPTYGKRKVEKTFAHLNLIPGLRASLTAFT